MDSLYWYEQDGKYTLIHMLKGSIIASVIQDKHGKYTAFGEEFKTLKEAKKEVEKRYHTKSG